MTGSLTDSVAALVREARQVVSTPQAERTLADTERRLAGPLRVAIAGKVKAGKSTLLNALLAEELAATDAGECTRIVTWYRHGDHPRVVMHPRVGDAVDRPIDRRSGALEVDLAGNPPQDVDHLEVWWPTQRLAGMTLIDTPGIASVSVDLAATATRALSLDDANPSVADAVIYLLRHTHASDIRFLESFHTDELARGTSMNAVGVLARPDEIGSCRMDALHVAERIAARYQNDPRLHRLCPVVIPVAGLLALGGTTLRESDFRALSLVAAAPAAVREELLLTADRFATRSGSSEVGPAERQHVLERIGLFGIRLSVELIRSGATPTAELLAADLVRRSGLAQLRSLLLAHFSERSDILKARSALASVTAAIKGDTSASAERLRARVEEITAGAHAFVEVRLLNDIRSGALDLPDERASDLERLLGGAGQQSTARLGLEPTASPHDVVEAAGVSLAAWQRVAEHPLSSSSLRRAARVAVRTVEGILVSQHSDDQARDEPVGPSAQGRVLGSD